MGARELGAMCEAERKRRGWSLARMAYEIGLVPPDDRALNESQAKRILEGRRGLDRWMVKRLISVFDLPEEEAWHAAGLWPPDLDVDGYRQFRHHLAAVGATSHQRDPKNGRSWRRAGERRRGDRRHLRVVPPVHAFELSRPA